MSFVEDIRVSLSVRLASGTVKKIRAICGLGLEKPLANYDLNTRSWKMYEATLVSEDCPSLENLPPSGMTQNGVLYLQRPWEPITNGIESLSWPTPTTQEVEHPNAVLTATGRRKAKNGNSHSLGLADAVQKWPTPQARDYKGASGRSLKGTERDLPMAVGNGGKLNPTWVEWLMGFPLGWTDLEDSETP